VNPTLWLLGVLLLYVSAGFFIVLAGLAVRLRQWMALFLTFVGVLAGFFLFRMAGLSSDAALCSGASAALLIFGGTYAGLLRRKMTWREVKAGREMNRQVMLHLVLVTGSVIFLVPFAWLVVTSLKEDEDMSQFPPVWIPKQQVMVEVDGKEAGLATASYRGQKVTVAVMQEKETGERLLRVLSPASLRGVDFEAPRAEVTKIKHFAPVWKNYPDALKFLPPETRSGLVFLGNTLILSALSIVGTVLSSSLVAFSFARLRWPGRDLLFVILLATMMLPGAVTMMPVFLIFRWLGWIDTLRPLWVPAFLGSAFNIFLLRQFFLTIPNDLEDAAKIDGCSYFGIYWRIMLPLIKPALAAITIMTFMGSWNNFMGPLIYISSPTRMPLAYALQLFQTAHGGEPGLLMAASTMMMLPVLLLFFFTQRYFIQGVTLTGIKG
jgi:multiple sugar transport system permease protein